MKRGSLCAAPFFGDYGKMHAEYLMRGYSSVGRALAF